MAALHHEKVRPDHGGVVAIQKRARRGREGLPQLRERAVLALHVVRAGGDGAERRPAQHVLACARARAVVQQIGEIRVAAAELSHRERLLAALELAAQPRLQTALVEALVRAHVDQLGRRRDHGIHDARDPITGLRAGREAPGPRVHCASPTEPALTPLETLALCRTAPGAVGILAGGGERSIRPVLALAVVALAGRMLGLY